METKTHREVYVLHTHTHTSRYYKHVEINIDIDTNLVKEVNSLARFVAFKNNMI